RAGDVPRLPGSPVVEADMGQRQAGNHDDSAPSEGGWVGVTDTAAMSVRELAYHLPHPRFTGSSGVHDGHSVGRPAECPQDTVPVDMDGPGARRPDQVGVN